MEFSFITIIFKKLNTVNWLKKEKEGRKKLQIKYY